MSICSTCRHGMTWAVSENGRPIPMDGADTLVFHPEHVSYPPVGSRQVAGYRLERDGMNIRAIKLGQFWRAPEGADRDKCTTVRLSHFSTCPNATSHSKGKRPVTAGAATQRDFFAEAEDFPK